MLFQLKTHLFKLSVITSILGCFLLIGTAIDFFKILLKFFKINFKNERVNDEIEVNNQKTNQNEGKYLI